MTKSFFNTIMVLAALFSFSRLEAQVLMSKHGERILPEKQDWCIGIDATKLIKDATFSFATGSQAIYGKYFKDSATAYRAGLRLGFNNATSNGRVLDRLSAQTNTVIAFPAPVATKVNSWTRNTFIIGVSAGIEKRRGRTRLQGVYGVEGNMFLSFLNDNFSYGNKLFASNSTPVNVSTEDAMSSPAYGSAGNIDTTSASIQGVSGYARILTRSRGTVFSMGARAFIGAEYFVLPKLSVGGEFGWGLGFSIAGRSETVYESIGQSNTSGSTGASVKNTTIDGAGGSSFFIDNDNGAVFGGPTASLRLLLYF